MWIILPLWKRGGNCLKQKCPRDSVELFVKKERIHQAFANQEVGLRKVS